MESMVWINDNHIHNIRCFYSFIRADSSLAPSQWQTSLQSNAVSHWLGANLESCLSLNDTLKESGFCRGNNCMAKKYNWNKFPIILLAKKYHWLKEWIVAYSVLSLYLKQPLQTSQALICINWVSWRSNTSNYICKHVGKFPPPLPRYRLYRHWVCYGLVQGDLPIFTHL